MRSKGKALVLGVTLGFVGTACSDGGETPQGVAGTSGASSGSAGSAGAPGGSGGSASGSGGSGAPAGGTGGQGGTGAAAGAAGAPTLAELDAWTTSVCEWAVAQCPNPADLESCKAQNPTLPASDPCFAEFVEYRRCVAGLIDEGLECYEGYPVVSPGFCTAETNDFLACN